MSNRLRSMKLQFAMIVLVAGIMALFVYQGLSTVIVDSLDTYFMGNDYVTKVARSNIGSLQDFVRKNHVRSYDKASLDEWLKSHKDVSITVFKDNTILYDTIMVYEGFYDEQPYYNVEFQDGTAKVYVVGYYGYKYYNTALMVSVIIAAVLFLAVCIGYMERKISYIMLLEREVKVLKRGSLETVISIKGSDELATLAEGLNEMRLSLKENLEMKEKLRSANKSLVTGLSHDLRTPLTTLMIYLELLENDKATDPLKEKQYLKKCSEKAVQIKTLSDQLFESVLISEKKEIDLEEPQMVQYVLEDVISDMIMFLESQGFHTQSQIEWRPVKVAVSTDYMTRIVNNISSNLLKYADPEMPVKIGIQYAKNFMEVSFTNGIPPHKNKVESTKMGVHNIRSMMEKMSGTCEIEESDNCYKIKIRFPVN